MQQKCSHYIWLWASDRLFRCLEKNIALTLFFFLEIFVIFWKICSVEYNYSNYHDLVDQVYLKSYDNEQKVVFSQGW